MMKKFIFLLLVLLFSSFAWASEEETCLDYSDRSNWVVLPSETELNNTDVTSLTTPKDSSTQPQYDIFYVYPTLTVQPIAPYMIWKGKPDVEKKTRDFVRSQTEPFGNHVRIFAPYVRQLDFTRCLKPILNKNWSETMFKLGIGDTCDALRYYLKHYNHGRPYILLGHSQGAIELYEAIHAVEELSPQKGFVVAYLIGLPKRTAKTINAYLKVRGVHCAQSADDLGVVVAWNAQKEGALNPIFAIKNGYCINPLTWTTAETPADKSLNKKSILYDFRVPNYIDKIVIKENLTGARVDKLHGVLIVDLPENSLYDLNGLLGVGVFHPSEIYVFFGALIDNANLRVTKYISEKPTTLNTTVGHDEKL